MAWWIKTCLYFSAFMIPSIRTISPTPLAEMQPQTRTDPPPCFTEGHKHSFFHLSPTLLLIYCRLDPKISNLDLSLHNTLFHWSSFQSLWALAYLSLFTLFPFRKSGFLAATLPQRPFLIKLLRSVEGSWPRWSCQMLSQVLAGLPPVSQRNLENFSVLKVFLAFQSIFCPPWPSPWVSSLFADFPLRVALLMQNYDFMSVKFCDLWHFEWNDVIESWSHTN